MVHAKKGGRVAQVRVCCVCEGPEYESTGLMQIIEMKPVSGAGEGEKIEVTEQRPEPIALGLIGHKKHILILL